MEKHLVQVLEAVQRGCDDSHDISDVTGIRRECVSNYLTELRRDGLIVRRRGMVRRRNERGPPCFVYDPA